MKWILQRAIPAAKIFQLASSIDGFQNWLIEEHERKIDEEIFNGYKYFLDCAFSTILDSLASDDEIGLKGDFLLSHALGNIVFIEKLPNSSEKTVVLKNIYRLYKPVFDSKNIDELKINIISFQREVLNLIELIFSLSYSVSKEFKGSKNLAVKFLLIESMYLLFNQVKGNGPVAYEGQLLKEWWPSKEKRDTYLEGYKYTNQFIWFKILGEKRFRKSSLKNIHKIDSWKDYIYHKPPIENPITQMDLFTNMMNKTFDIEAQTSFDSYFYRIQNEIVRPLEKRQPFFMNSEALFSLHKNKFSKKIFSKLLDKKHLSPADVSLEDELDMLLYWYPVDVVNEEKTASHNGIPTLITLLTGSVALLKSKGEFNIVRVCKFIHPVVNETGNDYSYAILIDAKAAAGHYSSGWLIFYDCCGDYSGFSGGEYRTLESKIESYLRKHQVSLAIKEISKDDFKNYLSKYLYKQNSFPPFDLADVEVTTINEGGEIEFQKKLETITKNEKKKNFIADAKGLILELISYYVATKYFKSYPKKDWSIESGKGEMDVIIENDKEVLLIECKLNVNNHSANSIITKARNKLKHKYPNQNHLIEIWSWASVSNENLATFSNNGCICYSLSTDRTIKFINHLRLPKIKPIFEYDERQYEA